MQIVEIKGFNKEIKGISVLHDINLTMKSGQVYGLMGDNGSGKTMLMRAICGLIRPTSGDILFDGKKREDANPTIGAMIENTSLYPYMTGSDNLRLLAKIRRQADADDIRQAISRVGLDPNDKRVYRKYSLGMKQRLLLAQAIMEKPDVLLLDEPTNAIDKAGVELVHTIMQEEAKRGAVVLLASHIDVDIRNFCSSIYLMEQGSLCQEVSK